MVLVYQKTNAETVAEAQQPDVLTLELVTMMQQHLVMIAHVNLIHAPVVQIRQPVTMIKLQR
ncbi:MAG: hypothetical protein ACJAQ5_001508 [Flavobacteriales bacterium]|jgi:hypothetical protein